MAKNLATPEVVPVSGGWMAKSTSDSALKLAVIEDSKEAALKRFSESLAEWERLLAEPDEA